MPNDPVAADAIYLFACVRERGSDDRNYCLFRVRACVCVKRGNSQCE